MTVTCLLGPLVMEVQTSGVDENIPKNYALRYIVLHVMKTVKTREAFIGLLHEYEMHIAVRTFLQRKRKDMMNAAQQLALIQYLLDKATLKYQLLVQQWACANATTEQANAYMVEPTMSWATPCSPVPPL